MTVKELITKLSTLPEDKPIRISVYDYVNCVFNIFIQHLLWNNTYSIYICIMLRGINIKEVL